MAESILWHPRVHRHFGETLHYFLFRFNAANQGTMKKLSEWLRSKHRLTGFCLYPTLGVYDALLRIWLNPKAAQRFLEGIKTRDFTGMLGGGAAVSAFESIEEHHYAFVRDQKTPEEIDQLLTQYYTPDDCRKAQDDIRSNHATNLQDQGLCNIDDTSPPGMMKFYIAVTSPPPIHAYRLDEIKEALRNCVFVPARPGTSGIDKVSLYSGQGFAAFLVKGVAENVELIMSFAIALRSLVSMFEMYTFTILLGRPVHELEEINQGSLEGEYGVDPGVAYWIPELFEKVKDEDTRHRVAGFVRANNNFRSFNAEDQVLLRRLIIAGAAKEESSATGAEVFSDVLSAWFRRLESRYRPAVPELANRLKYDFDQVRSTCKLKGTSYQTLTLKEIFDGLRGLLKLEIDLPQKATDDLAELRNDVQHGRRTYYLTNWEKTIEQIAVFLPLLQKLDEKLTERGTGAR